MIKLLQGRAFVHGFCFSLGLLAIVVDPQLNPHLYGEVLQWTWRSTLMVAGAFLLRLVLTIVAWSVERRQKWLQPANYASESRR